MAAIQRYMSPSMYGAPNMYTQPTCNNPKNSDILKLFRSTSAHNQTVEPQETEKTPLRGISGSTLSADEPSFFDFEPSSNAQSPYQHQFSTPGASGVPWGNDTTFRPLSPPTSATFSPKDWSHNFEPQNPTNILTNVNPANTRTQYGQVTPPDDEHDKEDLFGYQVSEQSRLLQSHQPNSSPKKRKRNNLNGGGSDSQSIKRSRHSTSQGVNAMEDDDRPEDVKRSKFLERNRVAASKCRQKKKEWTQNLETRARELQKDNNMMRMNVDSLRQEVIFLKSEMLKHNSCDCHDIQEFIKTGTNPFTDSSDDDVVVKRENSPFDDGVLTGMGLIPSNEGSGCRSHTPEPSNTSILNDEHAFEALLSSSISHNTSNEGIESKMASCSPIS